MKGLLLLLFISFSMYGQDNVFKYELDLATQNDAFNVTLLTPQLSEEDNIYSFVSYAPGVHQPLDFGRFVKMFKVYDEFGHELIANKISINDFKILEPTKVTRIVYEMDDAFDMSVDYHPIYPMSGTGITDNFTIVNTHGVFGYFPNLKDDPIQLEIKLTGNPKVGTALNKNENGKYIIDSYYHFTDSPILIGDSLSYASGQFGDIKVEAFVYSPTDEINAEKVLEGAKPILEAAVNYIEYAPVDRYTFLMYFASDDDIKEMPVLGNGGALEHSLSSTYALPGNPAYLPMLNNIIAHEFMHILSPLHLHSNVLANFDYSDPLSEDQHVWLYEGVTEWVSYAMQVRSGNVTFVDYLEYLSKKINSSLNYSEDYSLTRISREWSTDEGNKAYGNIYQLGSLTAAMLDLKLLQLSGGEKGLREVYLELIQKFGKEQPFENETFFQTLIDMTYPEIEDFIEDHIKQNTPFDFQNELKPFGISYYEERKNPDNLPAMGLRIRTNTEGKEAIEALSNDYGGDLLMAGDVITRINGQELTMHSYWGIMDGIKKMAIGDEYQIDIIRDGIEMKITEKLYPKYDKNVFVVDGEANKKAKKMRKTLVSKR